MTVVALSRGGATLPDGTAIKAVDLALEVLDPALFEGVDVVFHLAGIAHQQAEQEAYSALNHGASVSLAKVAAAQGVKCFIYLSSVKAMGLPADGTMRGENDCVHPVDAYGLSKLQAEQDLRALSGGNAMSMIILRPCLVYGAAPKGNLARLARAVRAGLPRPPEVGGRSMIAVGDLVELMIEIASRSSPRSGTWIVSDGNRYSLRVIYDFMRQAMNKQPGFNWMPMWAWRLAAFMADGLRRKGVDSTYDKLFGTEVYSNAALLQDFEWRPKQCLADVVAAMVNTPAEVEE